MPFKGNPRIEILPGKKRRWRLLEDLVYQGKRESWRIRKGRVSDGATSPRLVWWLIPPDDPGYAAAAILHDEFCSWMIAAGLITSRDADAIFRRIARELGTLWPIQWLLWDGVRWGAVKNPIRRPGVWRDLPLMLLISVLAAPIVVSVSLFVGIGLAAVGMIDLAHRLVRGG